MESWQPSLDHLGCPENSLNHFRAPGPECFAAGSVQSAPPDDSPEQARRRQELP